MRVLASKKRFATVQPLGMSRGGARRWRGARAASSSRCSDREVEADGAAAAPVELFDIDGHRVSLIHCSIRHAATRSVLSRPTRRRRNPERRALVSSVCAAAEVSVSSTVATGSL